MNRLFGSCQHISAGWDGWYKLCLSQSKYLILDLGHSGVGLLICFRLLSYCIIHAIKEYHRGNSQYFFFIICETWIRETVQVIHKACRQGKSKSSSTFYDRIWATLFTRFCSHIGHDIVSEAHRLALIILLCLGEEQGSFLSLLTHVYSIDWLGLILM